MADFVSNEFPNSTEAEETMQNENEIELLKSRLAEKDATIQVTKFSLKLGKISIETFSHLFRIWLKGLNLLRISIQVIVKQPC